MDEIRLRAWAHTTELEARFWSKVAIVDDDGSCWEWRRGRHPDEYGMFQWRAPGDPKSRAHHASRVAMYLTSSVMPEIARHTCDNPPCCRPSHLVDGSHIDNARDRVERGRAKGKVDQRGERNDSAVLTDEVVVEARRRARAGQGHDTIAAEMGFQRATLSLAIRGKTWAHLDTIEAPLPGRPGGTRLTEDDVRAIRLAREEDVPLAALATRYGITKSAISHIANGRSWGHVTS